MYVTLTFFASFPFSCAACQLCKLRDDAMEWLESSLQRIPRDTFKCFDSGKWTQIEGFVRFTQRCRGSWHLAALSLEALLAKLLGGGASHSWELEATAAAVQLARDNALCSGWRKTAQWIEEVVSVCDVMPVAATAAGAAATTPTLLSYNYDMRVQADYSPAALRTKAEWSQVEWVVPDKERDWLKSRCLLLLLIEAQAKGASFSALAAQLVELWSRSGVLEEGGRDRLAGFVCYRALQALLGVGQAMAAVHSEASAAVIVSATNCMRTALAALDALRTRLVVELRGNAALVSAPGLSADLSFASFQLLPFAVMQLRVWRTQFPSKGLRNKMDAEAKARLSELNSCMKRVADGLAALGEGLVQCVASLHGNGGSPLAPTPLIEALRVSLDAVSARFEHSWQDLSKNVTSSCAHSIACLASFRSE